MTAYQLQLPLENHRTINCLFENRIVVTQMPYGENTQGILWGCIETCSHPYCEFNRNLKQERERRHFFGRGGNIF